MVPGGAADSLDPSLRYLKSLIENQICFPNQQLSNFILNVPNNHVVIHLQYMLLSTDIFVTTRGMSIVTDRLQK